MNHLGVFLHTIFKCNSGANSYTNFFYLNDSSWESATVNLFLFLLILGPLNWKLFLVQFLNLVFFPFQNKMTFFSLEISCLIIIVEQKIINMLNFIGYTSHLYGDSSTTLLVCSYMLCLYWPVSSSYHRSTGWRRIHINKTTIKDWCSLPRH